MKYFSVNISGKQAKLPIFSLESGISVAFLLLHGNSELTEHCGKELAKLAKGCEVLITAESKGLQLTHVVARELGQSRYVVARKSRMIYMPEYVSACYNPSIIGGKQKELYISKDDADILKGKKVGIVDDVVSTGASLLGLEKLIEKAGGIVYKKLFVLAEGDAKDRDDVEFLATIPLL